MPAYEPSGETVTRTFRVKKDWDEIIKEEAQWQGISVSALLNLIVRRYIVSQRFLDRSPTITVQNKEIDLLLKKLSENDIEEAGMDSGLLLPEEALLSRGFPLNFESLAWLIEEICGRYNGWFKVDHYVTDQRYLFHLRHNISKKWSIYVGSFISSMFKSLLDIDIDPEIREDSVTIYIPIKEIELSKQEK
ncbi:hypothetical protein KAU18_08680 [Candidatus Bathyarchaeota archaeon]|nr:hypothetical protein [Candidatus Bathyarchaeota archaeon]MCK4703768.1 hypothetical protein [Candidatus Bathyarchaeota archaeon]